MKGEKKTYSSEVGSVILTSSLGSGNLVGSSRAGRSLEGDVRSGGDNLLSPQYPSYQPSIP